MKHSLRGGVQAKILYSWNIAMFIYKKRTKNDEKLNIL